MDFWSLIGKNRTSEALDVQRAIAQLRRRLESLTSLELVQFHDRLREYLYRLDRREFFAVPVPVKDQILPQSDDGFEYARCTVILSGLETYEKVLRHEIGFEEFVPPEQGAEDLLYVASEVYEAKTGRAFTFKSEFPSATGSNPDGWE